MVAVLSRAGWGAPTPIPAGRHVAPSARRHVVAHWPGGAVAADPLQAVRNIDHFHRNGNRWQIIGYNFLIFSRAGHPQDGLIIEGAGRDVRGIHEASRNVDGWGVCVLYPIGGQPSPAALASFRSLYVWLCTVAGRPLQLGFHGQFFATQCAGIPLNNWVRQGIPATPSPGRDWFDMATQQDLEVVVRRVLNEGTVQGQTSWAATNRATAGVVQNIFNRLNEISGQLANLARRIDQLLQ